MTGIHVRREGRAGRITLARPEALNALTLEMLREIDRALARWSGDPDIALVILDAEGDRAFCAGGDITYLYRTARDGDFAAGRAFWAEEYRVNARLARFPKPVVAFMQGYVMGGGVGLGGHVSHRIVGATSRVAMPECAIGLVPDIGASHLLAGAPGRLGEYLGLTGHRMGPGEALLAGFADHVLPEASWSGLAAEIAAEGDVRAVEAAAEGTGEDAAAPIEAHRAAIDAAFAGADLAAVRAGLPDDDWGRETAAILDRQCPLSMACTLALVRAARAEPGVERALAREYRFSWRSASEGDLIEGIRAAVIDKDRRPRWRDTIATVDQARVAAMLAPLGENELVLPGEAAPDTPRGG